MRQQPDFSEDFEEALSQWGYSGAEPEQIETRRCASDDYDGREYKLYGHFIPIRPIIEVITGKDNFAIEELLHVDEGDPTLVVFVADLREEFDSDAFVGPPF